MYVCKDGAFVNPGIESGEVFNCKAYGCGTALTDNTPAIRATIAAAAATTNGVALIPPGSYNLKGPIDLPDNFILKGSGRPVLNFLIYGAWGANAAENLNDEITDSNGNGQIVGAAGTTGSTAPAWSPTQAVTGASGTPITITVASTVFNGYQLVNGDQVRISGVGGDTNANGVWTVGSVTATSFTLTGASTNATFTSGGTVYGPTKDGTVVWYDNGSPVCLNGFTSHNWAAGMVRSRGSGWRLRDLFITGSGTAGSCYVNVDRPATQETTNFEIDHSTISGGSLSSTNDGIDLYATDTSHIHHNLVEYVQHTIQGRYTFANEVIGPRNNLTFGSNSSDYLVDLDNGGFCTGIIIYGNTFEGYGTTYGLDVNCQTPVPVYGNYFGDANNQAGTWVYGAVDLRGNWIDAGTGMNAINVSGIVSGNWIVNGPSEFIGGIVEGNTFENPGGCELTFTHSVTAEVENNSFASGNYSVCSSGLSTPPFVRGWLSNTDTTTSGIRADGTTFGVAWKDGNPNAYASVNGSVGGSVSWEQETEGSSGVSKKAVLTFSVYQSTAKTLTAPTAWSGTPAQYGSCPSGLTVSGATISVPDTSSAAFPSSGKSTCIIEGQ